MECIPHAESIFKASRIASANRAENVKLKMIQASGGAREIKEKPG